MNDVEMTWDAWLWVGIIVASLLAGGVLLLRGLALAAYWIGGPL
ncbi:hypothetical protein [Glutamicibacter creatinolyticus]